MMKVGVVVVAFMASVSAAAAADLPSAVPAGPPVYRPPPVSPAYNWSGFYVGVMGGYGQSQSVTVAGLTGSTNDIKGGFAGGTLGYNWQAVGSPVVFGVEVDGAWSDVNYSETISGATVEDRIQAFGSVTGRVGVALDAALFYLKGGYAFADNRLSVANGGGTLFEESKLHSGWTVGGGIEYGFTPNLSGKLEYMYSSYASENYLTAYTPGGLGFGFDVHTVKAGINYRFGWGGPVVARY